jgi:hypothetical protein
MAGGPRLTAARTGRNGMRGRGETGGRARSIWGGGSGITAAAVSTSIDSRWCREHFPLEPSCRCRGLTIAIDAQTQSAISTSDASL